MNKITNIKRIKQIIGGSNNNYQTNSVDKVLVTFMPGEPGDLQSDNDDVLYPESYNGYPNNNTNSGSSGNLPSI